MKAHRLERVAEVIREVASETILYELRDPRIRNGMVTVTRAEVSGDLQHAKVYVSIMGTPKDQKLCLPGLEHAAGFIQSKVGDRMKSRYVPHLEFVLDEGVRNSQEVARLLAEERARTGQEPEARDQTSEISEDESGPDTEPPTSNDHPSKRTDL